MNKKSIIFTLDAILAILIAGVMITASYFYISQANIPMSNRPNLHKISMDALAVLEKDSTLKNSVQTGSASGLSEFLNSLAPQICSKFTIYDDSSTLVLSALKSDCNITQPVLSRRIFVLDNFSVYYAESKLAFS